MIAINDKSMVHKPEGAMKKILGYGASGEINGYNGIIKSVMLSNYQLNDVISNFIESDSDNTTCTIGLPLLMRFNLVFDYFNELLYIEPNMKFNDPFTKE